MAIFGGLNMRIKISVLLVIIMILSTFAGCTPKYPESVESNLVEGEDYIDHATTFNGKELTFDESMWYVPELWRPLPRLHVHHAEAYAQAPRQNCR